MVDTGLKNKVVLVTGANNPYGIGAGIAKAFAAQGAALFLHYLRQRTSSAAANSAESAATPGASFYADQQVKSADETLDAVHSLGGQAFACEADLSDPATIPVMFDKAESDLGPVEVLINNAAYWEGDTFIPHTQDLENRLVELWTDRSQVISAGTFDRIFTVNTRAPALLIAEFARRHIERKAKWGRILNVSTAGAEHFPSEITYGASKLALESYTRSAALELARFGVTVNIVSLGPVQTGWITKELEREILPTIPLGRIGTPEDVADAVVFLASHQARWITGQRLFVSGGHAM